MRPSKRSVARALLMVFVALGAAACSTGPSPAATVSGSDITNDQLAKTAGVFKTVAGLQQQPCGQTDGDTDTPEAACNRFSLGALIQFREADLYAQANGVTVDDAKVQKALDSFQQSIGADKLSSQLSANDGRSTDRTPAARAVSGFDRGLHDGARRPHPGHQ